MNHDFLAAFQNIVCHPISIGTRALGHTQVMPETHDECKATMRRIAKEFKVHVTVGNWFVPLSEGKPVMIDVLVYKHHWAFELFDAAFRQAYAEGKYDEAQQTIGLLFGYPVDSIFAVACPDTPPNRFDVEDNIQDVRLQHQHWS